jgi:hypothetical protein
MRGAPHSPRRTRLPLPCSLAISFMLAVGDEDDAKPATSKVCICSAQCSQLPV